MMFVMHISVLLALAVLLGSTALVIWSRQNKGEGACFGKKVGYISFFLSLLSLVCIGYSGFQYWAQGEFESSRPMPMKMRHDMMQNMMGKMPQMGNTPQPENAGEKKAEEHSHNHQ
jgi:hypothetical protein